MSFNTIKVNSTDTGYTHSIFDISEYNSGAIYANLSAALAAVPQNKQQGGMTVKFIQQIPARYSVVKTENLETEPTGTLLSEAPYIDSGTYDESQLSTIFSTLPSSTGAGNALTYYVAVTVDETTTYTSWVITKVQNSSNKYVQYRLMSDTFNTTPSNWQGVDDEPVAGSDNLVKSGGVQEIIFNNSFWGKGTTYVESKIYGLIPGNTYRLWLEKTSWDFGRQSENANVLDVGAYYNRERIERYFHYYSRNAPFNKYYDITIPENIDYLSVGGRASVGVRVRFTLEDITISNEIKTDVTKINYINQVVTPIEVIGQGNTYIETELPDLKAGSSYIFNIPNWDKAGITEDTSPRLFSIQYYDSENVERLLVRVPTISLPDNSYFVNIPTDATRVTMGTRLALNATVTIVISGADYYFIDDNKINSVTEKIEDNYSRILNSYFVGKDTSFVEQKFFGLIPGNTYRIYLEKTT